MAGLSSLFSGVNFQRTIQRYANDQNWRIAEIDNGHAVLKFRMDSGRNQQVYILRFENTLEFSTASMAIFDSENQIPHYLSTLLLQRSAERKYGFWCIENLSGKFVYSCMHNAEMELIDSNYFGAVVRALISEVDDFEGILIQMLN